MAFSMADSEQLTAETSRVHVPLNNMAILDGVPSRKKPQMGGICAL